MLFLVEASIPFGRRRITSSFIVEADSDIDARSVLERHEYPGNTSWVKFKVLSHSQYVVHLKTQEDT